VLLDSLEQNAKINAYVNLIWLIHFGLFFLFNRAIFMLPSGQNTALLAHAVCVSVKQDRWHLISHYYEL
jgi:hypothetical protein